MKSFVFRYWKLFLIIVFIGAVGFFWINQRKATQKALAVTTAKVLRHDFVKTIASSGKTKADKSVELKFQTSGKLSWVGVKEGDSVTAYQALAALDSREVQKNLEKALRDYSSQRNDFEQTWRVTYDGKQPQDAFTDTVKRILEKNQWSLEKAVLDVELKHLAVEYATLITPIAGIMTRVDTPVAGVNITPATAVFAVADPTSLIFEANVDETEIGSLVLGQEASITLDAFPEATFSGKVSYIAYTSQTSSGGATVFPVRVTFDSPQSIRIGLNGDVVIISEKLPASLVVPVEALREEGRTKYVYRKEGKTYKKVVVTTGSASNDEVVITSGLAEGDEVVTRGFSALSTNP